MKFKLSKTFLDQYRGKQPEWGPIGYVVYKRSYARELNPDIENSPTEEWVDTCQRVVEGVFEIQRRHIEYLNTRWDTKRAQRSAQEMFALMFELKFLPPGRGLWAMGTTLVMDDNNGAPLYNCAFVSTDEVSNDFAEPFCWTFSASAHGIGVGFDTAGAGKVTLVEPKYSDNVMIINDSREGWVDALRVALNAFIGTGTIPKFDYSTIRPHGAKIKRFGGTASGPESLQQLLEIDLAEILTPGELTSTKIVDLMNCIGRCVVAGGARRSAEIALGNPNDQEFVTLKLDKAKLDAYRWASNNSLVMPRNYKNYDNFIKAVATNGEPGFIFLDNAQQYGRMSDPPNNKDRRVRGVNPCGEITLESFELCNIAEIFISRCKDFEEFKRALKYGYLYTKSVTLTKTPWPRTNEIMLRNRRIGLSQTGIIPAINRLGFSEYIKWCRDGYDYIQELDKLYSDWLCIPRSIKTTTVKPSGTVSLLPPDIDPGIHYPHGEFIIRRVEFMKHSPILQKLLEAGYRAEDCKNKPTMMVVEFPVKHTNFHKSKQTTTIWEQLENAAQIQAHWSDNAVSITVDMKPEEEIHLKDALERYQHRLKTVSFLPLKDHGYEQAPYEEITEEDYNLRISEITTQVDLSSAPHEVTERFCDSDVCMIS